MKSIELRLGRRVARRAALGVGALAIVGGAAAACDQIAGIDSAALVEAGVGGGDATVMTAEDSGSSPVGDASSSADTGPAADVFVPSGEDASSPPPSDAGTDAPIVVVLPIWAVDFGGATPGDIGGLSAYDSHLSLTRDSGATVQTSAIAMVTTVKVDEARIGSTGAGFQGLVVEEARTNLVVGSRSPTGWTIGTTGDGGTGPFVTGGYANGPDGVGTAWRIVMTTKGASSYDGVSQLVFPQATAITLSAWARLTDAPGSVAGSVVQIGEFDVSKGQPCTLYSATPDAGTAWQRVIVQPSAPVNPGDQVAVSPGFAALCKQTYQGIDEIVDLVQAEPGAFATEPIITQAAAASRAGDHLQIVSDAGAVENGQLSLHFTIVPKGGPTEFASKVYLFSVPASGGGAPNTYAYLDPTTQEVTLAVDGTSFTGNPVAFDAGSPVEWFIRAGGGTNSVVEYRVAGSDAGVQVAASANGVATPAIPDGTSIDVLSQGTASQFSVWLESVSVYQPGQAPAGF